ncbi:hypothetical protein C5612_22800 [Pseudomonas frederiksbergensis]|uniref:Uncharacterized protein n=1 Tax=Pseudomonas frederiksbergensis TaxID=104087 RepID=A0A2S8HCT9_9PSED|nr:hypothetical protein C5612_22800 [Pseudomonas frederiksbergensis]
MLTGRPLSRASPLPQGHGANTKSVNTASQKAKRRFYRRQKRRRPNASKGSVHEQGNQNDDRDRHAEQEQQ